MQVVEAPPPKYSGTGQAFVAMGLGFLVIVAGLWQTGADEEFLPRFHLPWVTVAFGLPPVVLGLFAVSAHERGGRSPFLLRNAGSISFLFLVCALATQGLAECVASEVRFDMNWSLGTYKQGSEDRTRVRLEFVDHPGWVTDIESKELADFLVARGPRPVPVTFRVIRDFGRLREFRVIQVADRREWTFNDRSGGPWSFGWSYVLIPIRDGLPPPPIR